MWGWIEKKTHKISLTIGNMSIYPKVDSYLIGRETIIFKIDCIFIAIKIIWNEKENVIQTLSIICSN